MNARHWQLANKAKDQLGWHHWHNKKAVEWSARVDTWQRLYVEALDAGDSLRAARLVESRDKTMGYMLNHMTKAKEELRAARATMASITRSN